MSFRVKHSQSLPRQRILYLSPSSLSGWLFAGFHHRCEMNLGRRSWWKLLARAFVADDGRVAKQAGKGFPSYHNDIVLVIWPLESIARPWELAMLLP